MMEVQQVTTRNKAKNMNWAEQDEIRKAAKVWVEKANDANVERMQQEFGDTATHVQDMALAPDPICKHWPIAKLR